MPPLRVKLWDVPVRLVHWLMVGCFGFSWWSAEADHLEWHVWSGLTLLGLVFFRVVWGFCGSDTARFAQFVRGPRVVWAYVRGRYVAGPGHNPLGGWSVLALLGLVLLQTGLGLFAEDTDGLESGPLAALVSFDAARWAAGWHGRVFNALLAMVCLHVAAIFYYVLGKRQALVRPMVTGYARAAVGARLVPVWRALFLAALAVAFVIFLSNLPYILAQARHYLG